MPQQAMPRRRRRQPVIINETRDNYYLRCSIDSEITLVDIRYLSPTMLDKFIDLTAQDVLFLYSTLLLNNSAAIK